MKAIILFIILFALMLSSCGLKKPTQPEGKGTLHVQVIDDVMNPIPEALVQLISHLGEKSEIQISDSSGMVTFLNIASSDYTVSAYKQVDESIARLGSEKVFVVSGQESSVTVSVHLNTAGLKINEIYYAGPVNNEFYFYDQFVELYNGSEDTVYLDGTIIIRCGGYNLAGQDIDGDGDLDYLHFDTSDGREHRCFVYAFQLLGEPVIGKEYPLHPGEFAVVAIDAIDHRTSIPTSIDLSDADYEFYNPYFFRDPNDPAVPDYVNIITGEYGRVETDDFSMRVAYDLILLASGEDSEYWDGIDIETIIDGVEYNNNKDAILRLDDRIDRGTAGVESDRVITVYSGMSIQRIRPGFDTNNSTVDFMILDKPTPGY
jgi:hypothetical protein